MEVGKNILEVTEEKRLRWFGHVKRMPGSRLPRKFLEREPEKTRRRGRHKERWIDGVRRSMTNHGLTDNHGKKKRATGHSYSKLIAKLTMASFFTVAMTILLWANNE
jgi:hypothetical protein